MALCAVAFWLAPSALRAEDPDSPASAAPLRALRLREELPDETRVRIEIQDPPDGAVVADSACGLFVTGRAEALRGEVHTFDVALVLDTSRSTIEPAGADIDSDGKLGVAVLQPIGSTYEVGCTDPGDSMLAAEVAAARALLRGLDPANTRVALVRFAGDLPGEERWLFPRPPAVTVEPLGADYSRIERALDAVAASEPSGGTNIAAGVDQARALLVAPDAGATQGPERAKIVFFFTDGWPTLPHDPRDEAANVREALDAAQRARDAGVRIHSFAIGREALEAPVASLELADRTGGVFTPVRHPADLVDVVGEVSFANLEGVELRNLTTGRDAESFRLNADGGWAGFVRAAPGANEIEVRARASDGADATRRLHVSAAPGGKAPTVPPERQVAYNALLEDCLRGVKALRMEAERERAEQVRRQLRDEIERERAQARERAAEQRKRLQLEVEEPSK